jgi:hypothetical protein
MKSTFLMYFLVTCVIVVLGVSGCSKSEAYDQSSPEAVLASAKKMVENGDARQLSSLIHADRAEMRALWDRFGYFLGDIEDLAVQLNTTFPKEIEELKRKAQESAEGGGVGELLSQMSGRSSNRRRGRGGGGGGSGGEDRSEFDRDPRTAMNDTLRRILADPFSWLSESSSRLTAMQINDEMSALLWDQKPIFPPVGLVIQKSAGDGKWYLVLPTHLPPMSELMPRTADEYAIWTELVDVFRNVAIEMRKDVASGKFQDLEGVSRAMGERAFIPMAMIGIAYSKAMEERRAADRAAREAAKQGAAQSAPASGG